MKNEVKCGHFNGRWVWFKTEEREMESLIEGLFLFVLNSTIDKDRNWISIFVYSWINWFFPPILLFFSSRRVLLSHFSLDCTFILQSFIHVNIEMISICLFSRPFVPNSHFQISCLPQLFVVLLTVFDSRIGNRMKLSKWSVFFRLTI